MVVVNRHGRAVCPPPWHPLALPRTSLALQKAYIEAGLAFWHAKVARSSQPRVLATCDLIPNVYLTMLVFVDHCGTTRNSPLKALKLFTAKEPPSPHRTAGSAPKQHLGHTHKGLFDGRSTRKPQGMALSIQRRPKSRLRLRRLWPFTL